MTTNPPATIWQPTDGLSEYDNTGVNYIVDTDGINLVDTTGEYVVDTGVTRTMIPATVYIEDNSI